MLNIISLIHRRCVSLLRLRGLPRALLATTGLRGLQHRSRVGRWGERVALRAITKAGLIPIRTNWRSGRGEVDIVAFDQRTLVVVEVKTRQADHQDSYTALSAVNPAKREILLKTTRAFRRAHGPLCRRYAIKHDRIDALEVYYRRTKFGCLKATELRWHRGVVRSPEHSLA